MLAPEVRNKDDAYHAVINRLTQKAAMRLRKVGQFTSDLAIKVKYLNGPRSRTPRDSWNGDTRDLLHALDQLWAKYPKKKR